MHRTPRGMGVYDGMLQSPWLYLLLLPLGDKYARGVSEDEENLKMARVGSGSPSSPAGKL